MSSWVRCAIVGLVLAAIGAVPAAADRGVAIDLGRIEIEQKLTPGGSYQLPVFGVRNPGTEPSSYRMGASPVESDDAEAPPASWFEFEPRQLTLEPGETRPVQARLVLPTGADPGEYIALVGAQIVSAGSGAQVGAAAAARTTFTVEPATTLEAWWLKLKSFLGDNTPWSWLVPALAALILAAFFTRRRFSLTVSRRSA